MLRWSAHITRSCLSRCELFLFFISLAQLVAMAASDSLNSSSFAATILAKSYPLSGLHFVFDAGPRVKRELRKGGIIFCFC